MKLHHGGTHPRAHCGQCRAATASRGWLAVERAADSRVLHHCRAPRRPTSVERGALLGPSTAGVAAWTGGDNLILNLLVSDFRKWHTDSSSMGRHAVGTGETLTLISHFSPRSCMSESNTLSSSISKPMRCASAGTGTSTCVRPTAGVFDDVPRPHAQARWIRFWASTRSARRY